MAKESQGPKPLKAKKLPRKRPKVLLSRSDRTVQESTSQEVGDMADQIMRAPKKKR